MPLLVLAIAALTAGCAAALAVRRYQGSSPTGEPILDIARGTGESVAHHSRLGRIVDSRRHPGTATGLF